MKIVACDPGVKESAFAHFEGRRLVKCYSAKSVKIRAADFALIEMPRVYPGNGKGDPNHLVDLAAVAGGVQKELEMKGARAEYVHPQKWKGHLKKPPHHARVWLQMSDQDREILARAAGYTPREVKEKIHAACMRLAHSGRVSGYSWKAHNLLDAVGLGLYAIRHFDL